MLWRRRPPWSDLERRGLTTALSRQATKDRRGSGEGAAGRLPRAELGALRYVQDLAVHVRADGALVVGEKGTGSVFLDVRHRDALHHHGKLPGRHHEDSRPAMRTPHAFGHFEGRGRPGCFTFLEVKLGGLAAPHGEGAELTRLPAKAHRIHTHVDIAVGAPRFRWGSGAELHPVAPGEISALGYAEWHASVGDSGQRVEVEIHKGTRVVVREGKRARLEEAHLACLGLP